MFKKILIVGLMSGLAGTAFADDAAKAAAKQTIELKDGSTLYIFKDGKTAMADKLGKPKLMKKNQVMESKDGQKLMMQGDEVMRLEALSRKGHEGN